MNYKRIAEIMIDLYRANTLKEVNKLNNELLKIDFENRKMDIARKVLEKYRNEIDK